MAVDTWAVTFGTARRGLGGAAARAQCLRLPHCTKCNSPLISSQCTIAVLFCGSNVSIAIAAGTVHSTQ